MNNPNYQSTSNYSQLQSQVNEVKNVMTDNIGKILERGQNLENLQDRTEDLENSAIQFKTNSSRIKRKMWWKNTKMMIILVVVIVVIIVIVGLALGLGGGSSGSVTTQVPTSTSARKIMRAILSSN